MSEVPANVAAARRQVITTDYYALGYLALCMASYSEQPGSIEFIVDAISTNVPQTGRIDDIPGRWTLDWGPAITQSSSPAWKANLLFVASYRDLASDLPIFSAVVIRGTDIKAGLAAVLAQVKEDLDPGHQVPWPIDSGAQPRPDIPCIARGTSMGLRALIELQSWNVLTREFQTLAEFLTGFLAAPGYADAAAPLPLIVTGHSLGGCQTSPIALYINSLPSVQSGVTVVPNSFAASTAGNPAFANLYLSTLPHARRWFNTFDLIPMGFDNLSTVSKLWSEAPYDCEREMSAEDRAALELFTATVGNLQYAHEGGTANRKLDGACALILPIGIRITAPKTTPWGEELLHQHAPETGYWDLMVQQYASVLGAMEKPSWLPSTKTQTTSPPAVALPGPDLAAGFPTTRTGEPSSPPGERID